MQYSYHIQLLFYNNIKFFRHIQFIARILNSILNIKKEFLELLNDSVHCTILI